MSDLNDPSFNFKDIVNKEINQFNPAKDNIQDRQIELNRIKDLQDQQFKPGGLLVSDIQEIITILQSNKIPEYNNLLVNMLLNAKGSVLDAVIMDLLTILQTELGGNASIDISFLVQLVGRLDTLARDSTHPEHAKALQTILSSSNTVTDPVLKAKVQDILQGINQLDTQNIQMTNVPETVAPPDLSSSAPMSINMDAIPATLPGLNEVFNKASEQKASQNTGAESVIKLDSTHTEALSTLNNIKIAGQLFSSMMSISDVLPIFIILPVASQMLVQIGGLLTSENPYRVAIVTDYVAALLEYDRLDYIRKVNISNDLHYEIYEHYKQLYEDGYHFIISLHLNKNLKKTYSSAMMAKKHMDQQGINDLDIHVYNTNANGVGLGLMIYELVGAIKKNQSPNEVNQFAQQLVLNYKHWVCPLEFDFVKNHQWVMDLADNQRKVQMRLFHFIPVIELDKKLTIVTVSYTKEAALQVLIETVISEMSKNNRKINRICVEYRGVYRDAIKVRNQIKVKCPSVKVSLQSVGSLTTKFFGPELVGICII